MLIVTLAGGASTRHLVDATVVDALGPHGYLVNVSRGTTVDEPALLDALERGAIAGAALDVFWNEPNIDPRFLALQNVLLQPHHASGTVETRQAMGWLVRDNLGHVSLTTTSQYLHADDDWRHSETEEKHRIDW